MAELWRSWLGLGSSLGATMPGMAQPGQIAGETLGRFLDPMSLLMASGSQVGETIRKMTEGPRFADLGAIERRMGKVMQLWLQVQQAARAYEAVAAGAWHEASQRFAKEYQKLSRAGQAPKQPNEALKLWLDIANQTLLETHRSEPFLAAQGELLRHGMDFLLAEREMIESMVEPAGLPTRTEIDEVHHSVQELKRRVRALEKASAAAEPTTAAGIAPPDTRTQGSSLRRSPGMIPMPTTGSAELMRAAATFNTKVAAGITKLSAITDEQVQIATTPKDEVFKSDKVTLYRYRPLAKRKVATPVLIVYSLIGRYTMTDLQEDRSLIRNLLQAGPGCLGDRLGQRQPRRSLPHHRRLCAGLPRRLRRRDAPRDRSRGGQSAGHLRGRCVHAGLRRTRAGAGQEPGAHGHPARLPRRPGGGEARAWLPQCLDPQPHGTRMSIR